MLLAHPDVQFCAAGVYFLFMLLSVGNLIRDRRPLHFLLILFCASELSRLSFELTELHRIYVSVAMYLAVLVA